jgi:hypothetical protein
MNSDDIAEGILKVVFVLAVGAGVAFVTSSYPILLVPAVAIMILWGMLKHIIEGGINGATDVLLGVFGFGAFCASAYGYWVGNGDFAMYGVLTLFGIAALHGLREEVNRWLDERNARRLIGRP